MGEVLLGWRMRARLRVDIAKRATVPHLFIGAERVECIWREERRGRVGDGEVSECISWSERKVRNGGATRRETGGGSSEGEGSKRTVEVHAGRWPIGGRTVSSRP